MADACAARRARGAGARRRDARGDRRAPAVLRHLAEPGRFDRAGRAQARLRRIRAARRGNRHWSTASSWWSRRAARRFLEDRSAEAEGPCARESNKPVFMWTYTLPVRAQRRDPQRGRLSAVHRRARLRAHACAPWPTIENLRERLLRPIEIVPAPRRRRTPMCAPCWRQSGPVLCEWQARPLLAAYGIGGDDAGQLAHSAGRGGSQPRKQSDGPWR